VKAAVKTLHNKEVIVCSDVDMLERECRALAASNDRSKQSSHGVAYAISSVSA
jgi:hypothetical protein